MIKYSYTFLVSDLDFNGASDYKVLEILSDVHEDLTLVVDHAVIGGKDIVAWSFQYEGDSALVKSGINRRWLLKLIEKTIESVRVENNLLEVEWKRRRANDDLEVSLNMIRDVGKDDGDK